MHGSLDFIHSSVNSGIYSVACSVHQAGTATLYFKRLDKEAETSNEVATQGKCLA